jgi:hypothetical protein
LSFDLNRTATTFSPQDHPTLPPQKHNEIKLGEKTAATTQTETETEKWTTFEIVKKFRRAPPATGCRKTLEPALPLGLESSQGGGQSHAQMLTDRCGQLCYSR